MLLLTEETVPFPWRNYEYFTKGLCFFWLFLILVVIAPQIDKSRYLILSPGVVTLQNCFEWLLPELSCSNYFPVIYWRTCVFVWAVWGNYVKVLKDYQHLGSLAYVHSTGLMSYLEWKQHLGSSLQPKDALARWSWKNPLSRMFQS